MLRRSLVLKTIAIIVVIAGLIAAIRMLPVAHELARFQQWVRGQGIAGYVVYAIVYAVCVVLLVPGSVLTIGAGAIFGVVPGTIVVVFGATLGASVAFLLARGALRGRIEQWASRNATFRGVDEAIAREGTKIVLLVRLSVVFPFTYINYALGLTGVRFWPYLAATFIGIVPATFAFVYIGAVAGEAASAAGRVRVAVYAVGAATALIASYVVGRIAFTQIRRAGVGER